MHAADSTARSHSQRAGGERLGGHGAWGRARCAAGRSPPAATANTIRGDDPPGSARAGSRGARGAGDARGARARGGRVEHVAIVRRARRASGLASERADARRRARGPAARCRPARRGRTAGRRSAAPVTDVAAGVARGLSYVSIALLSGVLAFVVWAAGSLPAPPAADAFERRARRLIVLGAGLGVIAGVLGILLHGAQAAHLSLWDAARWGTISATLRAASAGSGRSAPCSARARSPSWRCRGAAPRPRRRPRARPRLRPRPGSGADPRRGRRVRRRVAGARRACAGDRAGVGVPRLRRAPRRRGGGLGRRHRRDRGRAAGGDARAGARRSGPRSWSTCSAASRRWRSRAVGVIVVHGPRPGLHRRPHRARPDAHDLRRAGAVEGRARLPAARPRHRQSRARHPGAAASCSRRPREPGGAATLLARTTRGELAATACGLRRHRGARRVRAAGRASGVARSRCARPRPRARRWPTARGARRAPARRSSSARWCRAAARPGLSAPSATFGIASRALPRKVIIASSRPAITCQPISAVSEAAREPGQRAEPDGDHAEQRLGAADPEHRVDRVARRPAVVGRPPAKP